MIHPLSMMLQVQAVVVEEVLTGQEHEKKSKRNAMVQRVNALSQLSGGMIRNLKILMLNQISQHTHPPMLIPSLTDPVAKFELRIWGVPPEIESELKQLIHNSPEMALDNKESSPCLNDDVIGENINNTYQQPIDTNSGATSTIIEEDVSFMCQNVYMVNTIMNLVKFMVIQRH